MKLTIIPQTKAPAIELGYHALAGAIAHEVAVNLKQNTAAGLAADLYDLMGDPATPAVLGKQALLSGHLNAIQLARSTAKTALKDGRTFCQTGFGILRPVLGNRWNSNWNAAGFTEQSLAVPAVPLQLLAQFRAYLTANPTRESASNGFTAVLAQARLAAIQNTIQARETTVGQRWSIKAARDAAFKQLRKRLSGLRGELEQLLTPTDDRWYAFGFARPADGKVPPKVDDLSLVPQLAGSVQAFWSGSALAENYRVVWRYATPPSGATSTQVGLFADEQCLITGLPSGANVIVAVSARNNAGETQPTEAAILVP